MNGSDVAGEGAQKPPPSASAANGEGGENGEAALAKKRKKEGLKPIITTEGEQTGYVCGPFLRLSCDSYGSLHRLPDSCVCQPTSPD
jgi:hypothetical protein